MNEAGEETCCEGEGRARVVAWWWRVGRRISSEGRGRIGIGRGVGRGRVCMLWAEVVSWVGWSWVRCDTVGVGWGGARREG